MTKTPAEPLARQFIEAFPKSKEMAQRAASFFPNGVTHDLRYMEPFPIYVDRAAGAYKWDVDGHKLIDYWSGHGALLLGHSHPAVVAAVQKQMERGTHLGACHELELEWAALVQKLIPSAEKMRFVGSGTEATLMALRLARIATGKAKTLKFQGHFHGWNDYIAPAADPPYDNVSAPGIPASVTENIVAVPPNDIGAVERALSENDEIGSVILEPTGGHMGAVPIRGEFLGALRDVTTRLNRLLIFDEVVTGFRVHQGGAQAHYNVTPDLTTLAKILAGGLPGGCVAGRSDVISFLEFGSGKRKMRHPGTFNANPLSAAAGVAALSIVATGEPCQRANESARLLKRKLNELFSRRGLDWVAYGEFSCFKIQTDYDGEAPNQDDFIPYNGDPAKIDRPKDPKRLYAFRQAMLLNGVDLPGFAGIMSAAHTANEIEHTIAAVDNAIQLLRDQSVI